MPDIPSTFWHVVIPEETTNLIPNPIMADGTTGYSAVGGSSIETSNDYRAKGIESLKVTPGGSPNDGVSFQSSVISGVQYTVSFSFLASASAAYQLNIAGATLDQSSTIVETVTDWVVIEDTFTADTTTVTITIRITDTSTTPFYVDCVQLEEKSYRTTLAVGGEQGVNWIGEEHKSASVRSGRSPYGGRIVLLEDLGFRVKEATGHGEMQYSNIGTMAAIADGADYQRRKVGIRILTLTGEIFGDGVEDYHDNHMDVGDAFLLASPVILVYAPPRDDSSIGNENRDRGISIECRYLAGLEGSSKASQKFEYVSVSFECFDPFFTRTGHFGGEYTSAITTGTKASIADVNYVILQESDGTWNSMDNGLTIPGSVSDIDDDQIYDIEFAPNGDIIYVGGFTSAGSVANTQYIAAWNHRDGFKSIGVITFGQALRKCIVIGDEMFVAGGASTIDSVADTQVIAKYTFSTDTWSAVLSGSSSYTDGIVDMSYDETNDDLYVVGDFTTLKGVVCNGVAKISDLTTSPSISAVFTGSPTGDIYCCEFVEFASAGSFLLVGGDFTAINGDSSLAGNYYKNLGTSATGTLFTDTWSDGGAIRAFVADPSSGFEWIYVLGDYDINFTTDPLPGQYFLALPAPGTSTPTPLYDDYRFFGGGLYGGYIYKNRLYVYGDTISVPTPPSGAGITDAASIAYIDLDELHLNVGTTKNFQWVTPYFTSISAVESVKWNVAKVRPRDQNVFVGEDIAPVFTPPTHTRAARWNQKASEDDTILTQGDSGVRDIKVLSSGDPLVAGSFISPPANGIAKWGVAAGAWAGYGTGSTTPIYSVFEDVSGNIWAVGDYSTIGGVVAECLAYYNGSWNAVGSGLNGVGLAIIENYAGDIYVGGEFLDCAGVTGTQNFFKITGGAGGTVEAVSSPGATYPIFNGPVTSIVQDKDRILHIGGAFTLCGNEPTNNYVTYNPATNTWTTFPSGLNEPVLTISAYGSNIYLGGGFDTANGATVNHICRRSGTGFSSLSSGLDNIVDSIYVGAEGVDIGGRFKNAGNLVLTDSAVKWKGGAWSLYPVDLPGEAVAFSIVNTANFIIIGFDTTGTITTSASSPASGSGSIINTGNQRTQPIFKFDGPLTLYSITNSTTGKTIEFDNLSIESGDTATLDLENSTFSSVYQGGLETYIKTGSDFATWALDVGVNIVQVFFTGSADDMTIEWSTRLRSFSAIWRS